MTSRLGTGSARAQVGRRSRRDIVDGLAVGRMVSIAPILWSGLWSTIILVMTILPLNDVKTRFSAIADEVAATHDRVIVTRNGRPHVMVISIDDFESLQMTRELLAEPGAVQDILAADQEISAGDYHTLDDLRTALEERQRQEDADA